MKNDSKFTNQKFKLVGTRVTRPEGVDKVTGRARYGADTFAAGQLVGAILRSPHAHAKIRNIDTRRAEQLKAEAHTPLQRPKHHGRSGAALSGAALQLQPQQQ